jgi:hypothetical protein
MPHHRARHTPLGRWHVVARVVEHGETFAQAAAWANVSKSTVWELGGSLAWRSAGAKSVVGVSGRAFESAVSVAQPGTGR